MIGRVIRWRIFDKGRRFPSGSPGGRVTGGHRGALPAAAGARGGSAAGHRISGGLIRDVVIADFSVPHFFRMRS